MVGSFFVLITGSSPRSATIVARVFFPNCGHRYTAVRSAPNLQLLNPLGPPCVPLGDPIIFSPRSPGLLRSCSHRAAMAELGSAEQLAVVVAMLA